MKLIVIGLMIAVVGQIASAGTVCGTLSKVNTCGMQSCAKFFLRDKDRAPGGNPYLVEASSEIPFRQLNKFANSGREVCISGVVGANNDPDLLVATSVVLNRP